jgi:hypothetical protein
MPSSASFGDKLRDLVIETRKDVAPTTLPGHFRYMTLILFRSNLDGLVEAVGIDEPIFGMSGESYNLTSSESEIKSLNLSNLPSRSSNLFIFSV